MPVTALADDWGVTDRRHGPGKTVWAEYVPALGGMTTLNPQSNVSRPGYAEPRRSTHG